MVLPQSFGTFLNERTEALTASNTSQTIFFGIIQKAISTKNLIYFVFKFAVVDFTDDTLIVNYHIYDGVMLVILSRGKLPLGFLFLLKMCELTANIVVHARK